MQAVLFRQFGEPAEVLRTEEVPVPQPGAGEVRVRLLAAPVNPSDVMTIRGTYSQMPSLPATPGYEGVGIVESSGGGILGRLLKGKRVAVASREGGTWAEECVVPAKQVIPLPKSLPTQQGAMFFVNPVTAFVMTRRVLAVPRGEWLLQTAAGSSVGRMVIRLGRRFGFRTLNVVRREEQIDELKALGADAVVAFDPQHHPPASLVEQVVSLVGPDKVRFALDPVGGTTGSAVIDCLGKGGRLLVFGTLSEEPLCFSPRQLMGPGTSVEGFRLPNYLDTLRLPGKLRLIRQVSRLVCAGVLTSEVAATFPLTDVRAAVQQAEASGRGGKVLLTMES